MNRLQRSHQPTVSSVLAHISNTLHIAIDQVHEQNNALVKGDGGAIGLTENIGDGRWSDQRCRLTDTLETRKKRGTGSRRKVIGNGRSPRSRNTFRRCDENKTELFVVLAHKIIRVNTDIKVIVTIRENALSNKAIYVDQIEPCNNEETDTRMFLHAAHAAI
ncbi:unnamed protein product [Mytilus coruscus]|uniref:Uncharacterized protein n=1 Tax=Mytilus coruscus TaxID=42192 RepID=A0A6J8CL21_MYTCO|nr:unnamed protein product [Mytilus coruscus]